MDGVIPGRRGRCGNGAEDGMIGGDRALRVGVVCLLGAGTALLGRRFIRH